MIRARALLVALVALVALLSTALAGRLGAALSGLQLAPDERRGTMRRLAFSLIPLASNLKSLNLYSMFSKNARLEKKTMMSADRNPITMIKSSRFFSFSNQNSLVANADMRKSE